MTDTPERSSERVRVDAFVKVQGSGTQELVFRTRDLSEQGLFLYTRVARAYPFKVGSTLSIELYDYDDHVAFTVVVVRIVEPGTTEAQTFPTGFGVRIVDRAEPTREKLAAMIQRIKSGDVY